MEVHIGIPEGTVIPIVVIAILGIAVLVKWIISIIF